MTALAVEARGLEKRFGPVSALRGLDLAVPRGESLAVVGANGAGKSTLLRLLAGLARPSAGTLRVGDAEGDRRRTRAQVGYLGHATLLYPPLSARENLVFSGRLYGVADPGARADALLEAHGLQAVADRAVATFSRGMAQRLAIARAEVHEPALVLLDEPFTGLDPAAAERFALRLAALHGAGRTLVLVSHEVERAAAFAGRVIVLARGRIVHELRPAEDGPAAAARRIREALGNAPPGPPR